MTTAIKRTTISKQVIGTIVVISVGLIIFNGFENPMVNVTFLNLE